jgi:glutaconate CoA-transferase subunit B
MADYGPFEMIAYTGARVLEDETIVFVGTGLPIISAMFAQMTHAPKLNMIFEAGSLAAILEQGMPLSVGDTRAFIGGAQIDMYGNINSHYQGGTYSKPAIRFPGSGGAGAMAANCEKTIAIMALEKRRFVEKLDFVTSIGFGDGSPDYREKAGVLGSGPYRVISNQALFGFDEKTKRMMLLEVFPGKTPEDIQKLVSFELLISTDLKEMKEPSEEDLCMLREECDPDGYFLKRKVAK